jgi:hypothetical protein
MTHISLQCRGCRQVVLVTQECGGRYCLRVSACPSEACWLAYVCIWHCPALLTALFCICCMCRAVPHSYNPDLVGERAC